MSGEGSEERRVIYLDRGDSIGQSVLRDTEIRFRDWIYVPYYVGDKYDELIAEFEANGFVFNLDLRRTDFLKEICEEIRRIGVDILKRIYGKVYRNNHNSYSMPVYSGFSHCCKEAYQCFVVCPRRKHGDLHCQTNCLYTGDFDARTQANFDNLKAYYSRYWNRIGLVQVPHHGSEHNSDHKLYSHPDKLAIMSFGSKNRYGHPDSKTIDEIVSAGSVPIAVTEYGWTELRFEYRL